MGDKPVMISDAYDDNSPQAVLRVALAVALGDEMLDREEQAKLALVYNEIRDQMEDVDEESDAEDDVERISEEVVEELSASDAEEDRTELYEDWAAAITDPDLQELALVAALRVAGAGGGVDLGSAESVALRQFCELWDIDLAEMLEPFSR